MSNNPQSNKPRYQQLAQQIEEDITRGHFPLQSYLPGENSLRLQYNVSRYTVREAIRQLQRIELVSTQRGKGTQVISNKPNHNIGRFAASFQSIDELTQFAKNTKLIPMSVNRITADNSLSQQLHCEIGDEFLEVEAIRTLKKKNNKPLLLLKAYVASAYADIEKKLKKHQGPVYNLIEQEYAVCVREIRQVITPIILDKVMAERLQVPNKSPALQIHRCYLSEDNQVIEHGFSIQAAEYATASMTITYEKSNLKSQ